jgi:hypothetical protein
MMLTQAKDIEPAGIGELNLFEQLRQPLLWRDRPTGRGVRNDGGKAVDSNLHRCALSIPAVLVRDQSADRIWSSLAIDARFATCRYRSSD